MDCEDYNYKRVEDDWGQPLNPLAALSDGFPVFNATRLEELLHELPVPDPVDMPGLSMLEAVEVR